MAAPPSASNIALITDINFNNTGADFVTFSPPKAGKTPQTFATCEAAFASRVGDELVGSTPVPDYAIASERIDLTNIDRLNEQLKCLPYLKREVDLEFFKGESARIELSIPDSNPELQQAARDLEEAGSAYIMARMSNVTIFKKDGKSKSIALTYPQDLRPLVQLQTGYNPTIMPTVVKKSCQILVPDRSVIESGMWSKSPSFRQISVAELEKGTRLYVIGHDGGIIVSSQRTARRSLLAVQALAFPPSEYPTGGTIRTYAW